MTLIHCPQSINTLFKYLFPRLYIRYQQPFPQAKPSFSETVQEREVRDLTDCLAIFLR